MATTPVAMCRTYMTTSPATVYTVPAGTTAIVTNIVVSNISGSAITFYIFLDGYPLQASSLAASSSAYFDLKQVLAPGATISAYASTMGQVIQISGVEIN